MFAIPAALLLGTAHTRCAWRGLAELGIAAVSPVDTRSGARALPYAFLGLPVSRTCLSTAAFISLPCPGMTICLCWGEAGPKNTPPCKVLLSAVPSRSRLAMGWRTLSML